MSTAKRIYRTIQSSDGRVKLATLSGIGVLATALVLFLGVFPANAGAGQPSNAGVQPDELNYGGGSGGCAFIGSTYTEYHINNPATGAYSLPGGGTVNLVVTGGDTVFSYTFSPNLAAFQLTVNGGQKTLKYDNAASAAGPRNADGGLHAPTKGNSQTNLFKLSHINFCYGTIYSLSGLVYDDANVTGDFELASPDTPEEGVEVSVLVGGDVEFSTLSGADGTYSFNLPNGTYTVCEEGRDGRAQTEPTAVTNPDCAALGSYEARGYEVTMNSAASTGNDFGTATEVCGQTLTEDGDTFDGTIVVFAEGNGEAECADKSGALFETTDGDDVVLNFPLVGSGSIAAIADITKDFGSTMFEPLEYKQGTADSTFEVIPWCGLRAKMGADGTQFDPFLDNDSQYPSLAGISDPNSGDPSVACRVFVSENAEGIQRNILLIQDDPQFR